MFTCPICKAKSDSMIHVNGKPKLTCGKKSCKYKWNNAKLFRKLKADFHCPYCDKIKFIAKEEGRQYCTDGNCKRKHEVIERQKNKILTLDEMPVEDLQKAFPTFYGLVKINKTKIVKCLKCPRTFESTSGHRICAECARQNSNIGRLSYG